MKTLRQVHLYLGCIFAPLLIYFSLSGLWQLYRFNDLPKNEPASMARTIMHAASNPHTHSAPPGLSPKDAHSKLFDYFSTLMAVGIMLTTLLGLLLAFKFSKSRAIVLACLVAGFAIPFAVLWIY